MARARDGDLHRAAERGDTVEIERIVRREEQVGVPVTEASTERAGIFDDTPLHRAVEKTQIASITLLLQLGADPNAPDKSTSCTPVHIAAATPNNETSHDVLSILLENGSSASTLTTNQDTPLHFAACKGNDQAIDILLRRYVSGIRARNAQGRTPLHLASANGRSSTCSLLIANGARRDAQDSDGRTSLHLAASSGSLTTITTLLEEGANPRVEDRERLEPCDMNPADGVQHLLLGSSRSEPQWLHMRHSTGSAGLSLNGNAASSNAASNSADPADEFDTDSLSGNASDDGSAAAPLTERGSQRASAPMLQRIPSERERDEKNENGDLAEDFESKSVATLNLRPCRGSWSPETPGTGHEDDVTQGVRTECVEENQHMSMQEILQQRVRDRRLNQMKSRRRTRHENLEKQRTKRFLRQYSLQQHSTLFAAT